MAAVAVGTYIEKADEAVKCWRRDQVRRGRKNNNDVERGEKPLKDLSRKKNALYNTAHSLIS